MVFVDEAPLQFALPQLPIRQLVPSLLQSDFAQILLFQVPDRVTRKVSLKRRGGGSGRSAEWPVKADYKILLQ